MGIFDSLKKATGLGLNAEELYGRAWEKSVLLGPTKYGDASTLFQAAASKADEVGDVTLAHRARANSHLYDFIVTGKVDYLANLRVQLEGLDQIEQVGSRNDGLSAIDLAAEIDARLAEEAAFATSDHDQLRRAKAHSSAAAAFKRIFANPLVTYRYHSPDEHNDAAQSRYFLHEGLAAWHAAKALANRDPDGAAGELSRAMQFFNQARDESWSGIASAWSVKLKKRRTCWICHREFQGEGLHYHAMAANVTSYAADVVDKLGQDAHSLDVGGQSVVVCSPCASVVRGLAEVIAQRRAQELRAEFTEKIGTLVDNVHTLQGAMATLQRRISSLERR